MKCKIEQILFVAVMALSVNIYANESVVDTKHNLQWQDNGHDTEDIWKMSVGYCKQLHLDAKSDWRLATATELVALAKEKSLKKKFKHLQSHLYWSVDEDKNDELNAMTVYMGNGFVSSSDKCDKNFMLCVRDYSK
ncbi:Lcl domain-containing protein [Sulfurimonas sp.]